MTGTPEQLIKFLNDHFEVTDWKPQHIFDNAKVETHITGEPSTALFALVFDDGFLYDLFYYMEKKNLIHLWAQEHGLHMEQFNGWNALFYKEDK